MNKIKLLTIAVITLVVLNLGLLAILFAGAKNQDRPMGPDRDTRGAERLLIEKLEFSTEQAEVFRELKKDHKEKIDEHHKTLSKSQKALFDLLKKDSIDVGRKDRIEDEIGNSLRQINELHLTHFQDIKNLGNEKQKQLFNQFIDDMSRRFVAPPGPPRRPVGPPKKGKK
jgi:Spy/CpxP family protein refolding chaperone